MDFPIRDIQGRGILSVRKRNIHKATERKFWRRNTALPVNFKTFRPGDNGQPRSA